MACLDMQDAEKAKANGLQIDGGVELVTADVTKGAEYAPLHLGGSTRALPTCDAYLMHVWQTSGVLKWLPILNVAALSTVCALTAARSQRQWGMLML